MTAEFLLLKCSRTFGGASVSPTSAWHTHRVPISGLFGAHKRNHPSVLFDGAADGEAAAGHAGGARGHRQIGAGGSSAG